MSKKAGLTKSFGHAIEGLAGALKNEPNFRIHALLGIIALGLAYLLGFTRDEWVILFFTIAFVLILELINTSIEQIVDIVSPQVKPKAKIAKDVSASVVLVSAVLAMIIGGLLFIPKVIALLYK